MNRIVQKLVILLITLNCPLALAASGLICTKDGDPTQGLSIIIDGDQAMAIFYTPFIPGEGQIPDGTEAAYRLSDEFSTPDTAVYLRVDTDKLPDLPVLEISKLISPDNSVGVKVSDSTANSTAYACSYLE